MGIPRSFLWLFVTGLIVVGLVGLSYLALDKPNVVWTASAPHCPACRSEVPYFAHRCPACREEFDWTATPDDDSPWCDHCLAPSEDAWIHGRRTKLGDEVCAARVAAALSISPAAGASYLKALSRGECGWCAGTGRDLAAPETASSSCPVCFGEKKCIGCDGDRRVHLGKEVAAREWERYQHTFAHETMLTLRDDLRSRVREADEAFLKKHTGTAEASRLLHWPTVDVASGRSSAHLVGATAAGTARKRLEIVLGALVAD